MVVICKVHAESVESFFSKSANANVQSRRLMLLDDSPEGSRLSQLMELNLPGEHPEVGVGKTISVEISEISSIFSGRPRIRGKIAAAPAVKPAKQ